MDKQFKKQFFMLALFIFLFTSPLFLLIAGFDVYYDYYSKSIKGAELDLTPDWLAQMAYNISYLSNNVFDEIGGTTEIHNNLNTFSESSSLVKYLSKYLKHEYLNANAKITFYDLDDYTDKKIDEKHEILGLLKMTIPSGHFKMEVLEMKLWLILQLSGNEIKWKSNFVDTNINSLFRCNIEYDFSTHSMNKFEFSILDGSDLDDKPWLEIRRFDDNENNSESKIWPILLLYSLILISLLLYSSNRACNFGVSPINIMVQDKATACMFVYLLLLKFKDLLILRYYVRSSDSFLLYMMFLAMWFFLWIEIINACLILQYHLTKVLIHNAENSFCSYLPLMIYILIIVFHILLGYNFDILNLFYNQKAFLYLHNMLWAPYILANMYFKKRGLFDTVSWMIISFQAWATVNYFGIFDDTSGSIYSIISQWFELIIMHALLIWFLQMQLKNGSRFMLPSSMRSLKYDYMRQLHYEYSLMELKNHDLPHCDYWMIEIHKPGWFNETLEYKEYDMVREVQNLYTVSPCGHVFHYECLSESMRRRTVWPKCIVNIPRMDEFDD